MVSGFVGSVGYLLRASCISFRFTVTSLGATIATFTLSPCIEEIMTSMLSLMITDSPVRLVRINMLVSYRKERNEIKSRFSGPITSS